MQVGDLVTVETKHEGKKPALIVGYHGSSAGLEYVVRRLDKATQTIAMACDLEVISYAGR
tara:strand:+ start:88 stop:267 length:180 start_codon:yes stop_codon:yes gene_type:complete